jgi:hypothetical protein
VENQREMLDFFFLCSLNCDMAFKITVEFEIIIIDFLFIGDFKSYATVKRIPSEHLKNN